MSLYADYISERLGDEIIETDKGFLTYRFIKWQGVDAVYIMDLYVIPSERKNHLAATMANQVLEIAKKKGCTLAIGTVSSLAKNAEDSMKVLQAYGMSFLASTSEYMLFSKSI